MQSRRNTLLHIFLFAGVLCPCSAAEVRPRLHTARLDSLMGSLSRDYHVMSSLTIAKDGFIQYGRAVGYRVIDGDVRLRANTDTEYRIGSISKLYTAAIILQLVQEGSLSLTSTVDRYFPGIPNAATITISDLLTHRSGLSDIKDLPDFSSWSQHPRTKDEVLAAISKSSVHFAPGTHAEYNNSAYILLSYIIEQVCNKSYAEVLLERISGRLKLKHTYFATQRTFRTDESYSYRYNYGWRAGPETDWSIPAGAGGIVSSTSDMARFITALFSGAIVSRAHLDLMKTMRDGYGMGMLETSFDGKTALGHDGQIDNFDCHLQYFPDDQVAVAYCSNGTDLQTPVALTALINAYYDRPYSLPPRPSKEESHQTELSNLLATVDAQYFNAVFNTCDLAFVAKQFTEDFVFYQDQGYTSATTSQSLHDFMSGIKETCAQRRTGAGERMRRDVPQASLQVFPVNPREVIQTGTQHFYLVTEGHEDKLVEESKFSRVWRRIGGTWKMARELDYLYNTHLNDAGPGADKPNFPLTKDEMATREQMLVKAFDTKDNDALQKAIEANAEFYSDSMGMQTVGTENKDITSILQRSGRDPNVRITLAGDALEEYPIKDYGSLVIGTYRLCHANASLDECGDLHFVHIWKRKDETWQLSRSVSYGDLHPDTSADAGTLYDTILEMDGVLFGAFNAQDLQAMRATLSTTLEFFQDNEGLENYQQTIGDFQNMFARNRSNGLRRDIVPDSVKVLPVNGYGAIEVGEHRFCHQERGKDDCGTYKFLNIWRDEGGHWKLTRVVSYGH